MTHAVPTVVALTAGLCLLGGGVQAAEVFKGGDGPDIVVATKGDDRVRTYAGKDQVNARQGDDRVWGGAGADDLDAGQGADELHGGGGSDVVDAGTSDGDAVDVVYGDAGDDRIYARSRDDAFGGLGDDRIEAVYPANGMDVDCGPGRDTLIFNTPPPKTVDTAGCERVRVISAGRPVPRG